MSNIHLVAGIMLLALTASPVLGAYDVAKYCQLVKTDTRFPSLDSCDTYFACKADNSYTTLKCPEGDSFDKETQSCRPSSSVKCYYGNENPCIGKVGKTYVTDPKNCNGYVYCIDQVKMGTGTCPPKQIFNGKACDYGTCTNDVDGTTVVEVDNMCQIMKSDEFYGDFKECDFWHKCRDGKEITGNCTTGLVYNTKKGMCLKDPSNTMCTRVGNPTVKPSEPCNASAKDSQKGDINVCSVYYKCDGTIWERRTCSENLYFDAIKDLCVPRKTATPTKGCNRCQYATTTWVNDVDSNCQGYLTCGADGIKTANGTCGEGNYFSELKQGCIQGSYGLDDYRKNNGACSTEQIPSPPSGEPSEPAPSPNPPAPDAGGPNEPAPAPPAPDAGGPNVPAPAPPAPDAGGPNESAPAPPAPEAGSPNEAAPAPPAPDAEGPNETAPSKKE